MHQLPVRVGRPLDLFYLFWLPAARQLPAVVTMAAGMVVMLVVILAPWWTKPSPARRPTRSAVEARFCTGCEQCYLDCPYEAIAMVGRTDGREGPVALVDPSLCVGCGICTGSCAPMGVGPAGRTGRDQLAGLGSFLAERRPGAADVVVVSCANSAGAGDVIDGAPVFRVNCTGNLHTSTIEYIVRSGVAGVLVLSCPPRDCWSREGPRWLEQRLYHEREAELQPRVDRDRLQVVYAGRAESGVAVRELRGFRARLAKLGRVQGEERIDVIALCERGESEVPA